MQSLPPDVLVHVLSFLDGQGLGRCLRLSQRWAALIQHQDGVLWRGLYQRTFRVPPALLDAPIPVVHQAGQSVAPSWRDALRLNRQLPDGVLQRVAAPFQDEVWGCQWSPSGRWLGAATRDGLLVLFALRRCRVAPDDEALCLQQGPGHRFLCSITMFDWSPDERLVVVSLLDQRVALFDVQRGTLRHHVHVPCVEYDCHGRFLRPNLFAVGGYKMQQHGSSWHTLKLWRIAMEEPYLEAVGGCDYRFTHFEYMHCPILLEPSPGSVFVVFATGGALSGKNFQLGLAQVTEPPDTPPAGPAAPHPGWVPWPFREPPAVAAAAPLPPPTAPGPAAPVPELCGARLRQRADPFVWHEAGPLMGLAASPNHRYVLANIRRYEADAEPDPWNGETCWPAHPTMAATQCPPDRLAAQLSRGDRPLRRACELHLWNVETGAVERVYRGHQGDQHMFLSWPGFSPTSPHVAVGAEDTDVHVFHLGHEVCVRRLRGHTAHVNQVAWHPALRGVLASAGDDGAVLLWAPRDVHRLHRTHPFWQSLPLD